MKKLALAMAAAAAMAFSAPAFAANDAAPARMQLAQADVKVKVKSGDRRVVRKKVIVRHDRGLHRGWRHSRHYGARKTVVVKRQGPHGTVVKKKTVIR